MGLEGFTGNESILYHLQSPCRVMKLDGFESIERKEWVPDQHAHRHFKTFDVKPDGDEITGRRLLMWNGDVEISLCRPSGTMDYFFRNGEGDEVIFVHEGSGVLETIFGDVPYKDGDYIVVPRGTTYRFRPPEATGGGLVPGRRWRLRRRRFQPCRTALSRLRDAGADRDPAPLPQPVRADHRRRAVLPPRHPSADRAQDDSREGRVPGQGARARRLPDVRARLPPVRRRRLGRLPLPVDVLDPRLRADHRPHPPAAAVAPDVRGPELRDLLVLPAQARLRPASGADPVPPLESPVGGDDLLRLRQVRLAQAASRPGRSRCIPRGSRTARSRASPRSRSARTRRTSSRSCATRSIR